MTLEEKKIIDRINHNLTIPGIKSVVVTKEEYEICIKNGIDPKKLSRFDQGATGHKFSEGIPIGKYITRKGYYKIIDIKYNYKIDDGRIFNEMLITNFNLSNPNEFRLDEVIINPRPLFNIASKGPEIKLKTGMILHIIEDVKIVNNTYRIVWEIM